MKPIVSLRDVIQEMDVFSDDYKAYLNIQTEELITLSGEELRAAEEGRPLEDYPEWQRETIQIAAQVLFTDEYLELPDKFEIHEYSIMEDFCYSIEEDELRQRLLKSIRGRGAFRYFKDTIHEYGIADDWYQFRYNAFKRIAIEWLDSNNIAYTEDKDEFQNDD